jgi:predicted site-specific integrase-resolvase
MTATRDDQEVYLSLHEAARQLNVSYDQARRHIVVDNRIKYSRMGKGPIRVALSDVNKLRDMLLIVVPARVPETAGKS